MRPARRHLLLCLTCRYAVGLLDKRTGVMKYMEVSGGSIIRMEPHARGTNYGPSGHTTELEETAQARRAQNERSALAQALQVT